MLRISNWTLSLPTSCLTFHKEFLLILCKATAYIWVRFIIFNGTEHTDFKERKKFQERKIFFLIQYVLFQLLKGLIDQTLDTLEHQHEQQPNNDYH